MASHKEGTTLGPYRIVEQIGMGGMATVYKAYQPSMDRWVALKILPAHYAQDEKFVQRFNREARTIAKLEHTHILPVYDFGEEDGVTYLAMRYLEGGTLKEMLALGKLSLADAAKIINEISSALDYAHRKGVIHRDVKPANIMVDLEGSTYLTDFGIAKVLESTFGGLTESGAAIGTPAYMAPEQGLGKGIDARADIYALGVVLYEMVVGKPPYQADTPMAVALAHIHEPLPLPRTVNPSISEELELVILKALAKKPEDRYQSACDLADALNAALGAEAAQPDKTTLTALATEAAEQAATQRVKVTDDLDLTRKAVEPAPPAEGKKRRPALATAGRVAAGVIVIGAVAGGIAFAAQRGWVNFPVSAPATTIPGIPVPPPAQDNGMYDAFEDHAFDGGHNPDLWQVFPGDPGSTCMVAQRDGLMALANTPADVISTCGLRVARPAEVPGAELESLEVQMQLVDDYAGSGGGVGFVLRAASDDGAGRLWGAECGLHTDGRNTGIGFVVSNNESGAPDNIVYNRDVTARLGQWYTITLEIEPETMTIACLVDGDRIGTFTSEDPADIRERPFYREVGSWRMEHTGITGYIGYFAIFTP